MIITILAVIFMTGFGQIHAAEIQPDPTTYSYGSTSEYSGFEAVQPDTTGSATQLTNTGSRIDSSKILIALSSVAIFGLVIVSWVISTRVRRYYKLQR